uniref:Prostate transmembrane protein, androgen induced 1 n=1 Tax=Mus musculus TaxID=10090 RepID=A0AAQ4VMX0_MOUSE
MGVNGTAAAAAGQPNVSCACNCQRSLFPSMEITPLQATWSGHHSVALPVCPALPQMSPTVPDLGEIPRKLSVLTPAGAEPGICARTP